MLATWFAVIFALLEVKRGFFFICRSKSRYLSTYLRTILKTTRIQILKNANYTTTRALNETQTRTGKTTKTLQSIYQNIEVDDKVDAEYKERTRNTDNNKTINVAHSLPILMGNNASRATTRRNQTSNARSQQLVSQQVQLPRNDQLLFQNITTTTTTISSSNNISSKRSRRQISESGSRQQSIWSLGSLGDHINWSFSGSAARNSLRHRNKVSSTGNRKSFCAVSQRRSKTAWHRPLTTAIFSSHFKEHSRNAQFHIERLVAKGAFGVVFKVSSCNSDSNESLVYALKVLKKSKIIQENSVQQIKDEADIQKLCGHHPFIVQQLDLWQNRHNLHILSEYVPNGELFSKIVTFSIDLIRLYVAEIALALDFLHNAGIIYRDAKPENILLTETYHIKLTDFGLSKWLKLGANTRTTCGTFQYMAPEILRGEPYGHAVDWWSLGIITCQMFTDQSPDIKQYLDATFLSQESTKNLDATDDALKTKKSLISSPQLSPCILPDDVELLPHEAKDVIRRLLEFEPKQRIRSVLALQRIALYKNFKIDAKHLRSLSPLDIIQRDNINISSNNIDLEESDPMAAETFQYF